MKHSEIYDKHADRRKAPVKKKRHEGDGWDRKARVSFKAYVRDQRFKDAELDDDEDDDDLPQK